MKKNCLLGAIVRSAALFLAFVFLLAAAFISCENPSNGSNNPENPPLEFSNFTFQAGEPVKGQPSAAKDAPAGTFAAENGSGTVSYTLVNPNDGGFWDNDFFTVNGDKLIIAVTLSQEKEYKIYARASDGAGKKLEAAFSVEVFSVPKKPNGLAVIAGQRRLHLSWNRAGGADSYQVRYNTANDFTGASGAVEFDEEFTVEKAEIAGLEDAAQYYVQVRAKNAAGASAWTTTVAADTPTGDPIDAFWYTGNYQHLLDGVMYPDHLAEYNETEFNKRVGWDSGTDYYTFIPTGEGMVLKYGANVTGIPLEDSIIIYHKKFPAAQAAELAPGSMGARGLDLYMSNNSTRPDAGVFIYKHRNPPGAVDEGPRDDPDKVYYSTYYWGLGAIQRHKNAFSNGADYYGKYLIDMGNSAPIFPVPNLPPKPDAVTFYSPSLVHAKANYTLAHMNYHIAWISVPWYQRELQYLGKNGSANSDRNLGWIDNTPGIEYVMPAED